MKLMRLHRYDPSTAVPVSGPTRAPRRRAPLRLVTQLAVASLAAGAALLFNPAVAHAATPQDVIYTTQTRLVNKTAGGYADGHWKTCFHVHKSPIATTPTCTQSVSVSTAVQLSGGYSDKDLGSSFGFSVTVTVTFQVGWSYQGTVPAGKAGDFQVGIHYRVWTGGMEIRTCHTPGSICSSWSSPTAVRVEQEISPAGRFVYTSS